MTEQHGADLFTDIEYMRDGSYRWLWQVRVDSILWRAGITMSRTDAEAESQRALGEYREREGVRRQQRACTDTLNLDELERGQDADAQAVRRERARGHTEESDPANLGGL